MIKNSFEVSELHFSMNSSVLLDKPKEARTRRFTSNFAKIAITSLPASFCVAFQYFLNVIDIVCVGHLNDSNQMAAIGLATTTLLVLFVYPLIGSLGALDTLASTAYGNKQYYLCGVFLNRSILLMTLMAIPCLAALSFTNQLLYFIGQDELIADMVQKYIFYSIPGMFMLCYDESIKRFLHAQGYFYTVVTFQVIMFIFHIFASILFVFYLGYGYLGSPIAIACTNTLGVCMSIIYLKVINPGCIDQSSFHFFNRDSFRGWVSFLSLSLPSMFMHLAEGTSFEMMTIYASFLGVDALGANTIISNLSFIVYMISVGISISAATLIGNELGGGNHNNARQMYQSTYLLAVITSVVIVVCACAFTEQLLHLYTYNEAILDHLYPAVLPLIVLMFIDNIQSSLKGVYRGIGKQKLGFTVLLISYGIVGNVSSGVFAFPMGLGLRGIWFGHACAALCSTITSTIIFSGGDIFPKTLFGYRLNIPSINWVEEKDKALKRIEKETKIGCFSDPLSY